MTALAYPRPLSFVMIVALLLALLAAVDPGRASAVKTGRLDSSADAQITGETSNDMLGVSVALVGDVNGDGYADAVLGAPGSATTNPGKAFFVPGGPGGWGLPKPGSQPPIVKYTGEAPASNGERVGSSVAAAGDVNGDGFDDFLLGASQNDDAASNAGAVYLILGRATPTTGLLNTLTGVIQYTGEAANDIAGTSVGGAGDVNNDGFDDFVIGAPGNATNTGAAYLVLGSASPTGGSLSTAIKYSGETAGDLAGYSVAVIKDYENDGFDDILVGAPNRGSNSGSAYIVEGSGSPPGGLLGSAGALSIELIGEVAGDAAGYAVSSAGDVNGDGIGDFLIGAYSNNDGGADAGAAYLVLGRNGAFGLGGNINLLSPPTGAGIVQYSGEAAGDNAGSSVSPAGDVNGDGFDDLLIGAPLAGSLDNGSTYLVLGGADTMLTLAFVQVSLSTAIKYTGQLNNDKAGTSLAGGQDVNGDGMADLLIASPENDTISNQSGAAYLVFGDEPLLDRPAYRQRRGLVLSNHRPIDFVPAGVRVDLNSGAGSHGGITVRRHLFHPCTREQRLPMPIWSIESPKLINSATVDLRFKYTNAAISGMTEANLKLWTRPAGEFCAEWVELPGATVDAAHNRISVAGLTALGQFTILDSQPTADTFLPLLIHTGSLASVIAQEARSFGLVSSALLVPVLGVWYWRRRRAGRTS